MLSIILFIVCSITVVVCSLLVLFTRRIFYAGLGLSLVMIAVAGIYAGLGAWFLAAVQVLLYAGAVLVLVLFVVWTLGIGDEPRSPISRTYIFSTLTAAGISLTLGGLILFKAISGFGKMPVSTVTDPVQAFAMLLLDRYAYPFELTSLLLIVVIVAILAAGKSRQSS